MNNEGKIIILLGASGSGKTTIFNLIGKKNNIYIPVYYTTRECRKGEIEGKTYHYVTYDEFENIKNKLEFYYECHGHLYGIPNNIFEEYHNGKRVVLGISRKLIPKVKEKYKNVQIIYLNVDYANLMQRIKKRDRENKKELNIRLKKAKELIDWSLIPNNVDVFIDNNSDLKKTVNKILDVI